MPKANLESIQGTCLIFWDYDTQWGADRSRSSGQKNWGPLDFDYSEILLEILGDFGFSTCFAVVGAAALEGSRPYHDPAQIRRIHAAGHEIASHSLYHEWLPSLSWTPLLETVSRSKVVLEQCIGDKVTTFVPPFNQPFDYPAAWSFSLSERKATSAVRTNLPELCLALKESGYSFCRVAYSPLPVKLLQLVKHNWDRPVQLEQISGLTCVRLNSQAGFAASSLKMLERCARKGGICVVYGHPHSLGSDNSQNEKQLLQFLKRLKALVTNGSIRVALPRQLVEVH